jgi:cobalamin biosynthesis protein CobT
MRKHFRFERALLAIVALLIAVAVAGCASRGREVRAEALASNQMASAKEATPVEPPPSATSDECLWIGGSTPANWICNGKPYTQQKLHQLRENWEKRQQANQ